MRFTRNASMARRAAPLAELWAWLAGLLLPAGALVAALTMTLSGETARPVTGAEPSTATTTTLVAGASASLSAQSTTASSSTAPTPAPRESLSGPLLAAPMLAAGPAPQSVADRGPDVAVAGVQVQAPAPLPQSPS